jgi:molybdopterin/thiamine biosynthesis adenylyltransferase/rhodanese-related sulfurtransferase/molybdopterin converting factor small subunit
MQNKLFIPSPLRRFTDGNSMVEVEGENIKSVLDDLFKIFPDIQQQILDDKGGLRNFVNVYIDQDDIRTQKGFDTKINEGAEIRIIPSIAGGSKDDMLNPKEFRRYSRHFTLPEVGVDGQKKLKAAKVLIIGMGGLGCPVSLYLTAAGIGTIGVVDFDVVDETNLQRQILYGVDSVGQPKLKVAKQRLNDLNPYVEIILHEEPLTSGNALDIFKNYDIVIDGTDNFPTRYLVNDACVFLNKPNVYGSIFRFDGQASVFNHDGGPCYRCLYPEPPPPGLVPSCAEGGVLGVLPGIIGSIQATEAIKLIIGIGENLSGRLMLYDSLSMKVTELKTQRDENCVVCGNNPTITELIDYKEFCGMPDETGQNSQNDHEISVKEVKDRLDKGEELTIIDIRESFELQIASIPGVKHIPMNAIPNHLTEFETDEELIVMCRTGIRSAEIRDFLQTKEYKNAKNMTGGIRAWSEEIDSSVPIY